MNIVEDTEKKWLSAGTEKDHETSGPCYVTIKFNINDVLCK